MSTYLCTTIDIARPIAEVFDFVTTAGNWPRWHPASLSVSGATTCSAEVGECVSEEYLVAGRRGRVEWTVRERCAPVRWVIEGRTAAGWGGVITYRLSDTGAATRFEREFRYDTPGIYWTLLDRLVLRRRVRAESREALWRLKGALEGDARC